MDHYALTARTRLKFRSRMPMLNTQAAIVHSAFTFSNPRRMNARRPNTALIVPNHGSTVCRHNWYRSLFASSFILSIMRSLALSNSFLVTRLPFFVFLQHACANGQVAHAGVR